MVLIDEYQSLYVGWTHALKAIKSINFVLVLMEKDFYCIYFLVCATNWSHIKQVRHSATIWDINVCTNTKYFTNMPRVIIFNLLVQWVTINEIPYKDWTGYKVTTFPFNFFKVTTIWPKIWSLKSVWKIYRKAYKKAYSNFTISVKIIKKLCN